MNIPTQPPVFKEAFVDVCLDYGWVQGLKKEGQINCGDCLVDRIENLESKAIRVVQRRIFCIAAIARG